MRLIKVVASYQDFVQLLIAPHLFRQFHVRSSIPVLTTPNLLADDKQKSINVKSNTMLTSIRQ